MDAIFAFTAVITRGRPPLRPRVRAEANPASAVVNPQDAARLSPLGHEHISFLGRYAFVLAEPVLQGQLRPLALPEERGVL